MIIEEKKHSNNNKVYNWNKYEGIPLEAENP